MKEYVIELNQDEVEALYIVTGYIGGGTNNGNLRSITKIIYGIVMPLITDREIYIHADGIIYTTNEKPIG